MDRKKNKLLLLTLFCLCFSAGVYAAGIWDGGGADPNWSTAANWDNDVVPTGSTVVYIRKGTTSADGPLIDGSVNLTGLTGAVHVSQTTAASNYVTMTGGTYATSGILYLGNVAGYKGYWDIQGGEATFGDTWVPGAAGNTTAGVAEGYLDASGGILNCRLLLLGRSNGPDADNLNIGEVKMTGNSKINLTINNADSLVIGYQPNTSSTLTIDDNAELQFVDGSGVRFARSGGAAVAILNMKGGLLNMPGTGTNAISLPHGAGTGYINMTGGTINVPNIYMSAAGTPSTGVVNMSGGIINVAGFWQAPRSGNGSQSIINMDGGTINVDGRFALGWNATGSGVLNMTAGTINAASMEIALAGASTLAMSGGAINAGTLLIGNVVSETVTGVTHSTLSGGTITADVLNVGPGSDLTISGTGTLKLKGSLVAAVYDLVSAGKLKTVAGHQIYAYYDIANDETVVTAPVAGDMDGDMSVNETDLELFAAVWLKTYDFDPTVYDDIVTDDFESYADTAALETVWLKIGDPNSHRTLTETGGYGGTQGMVWTFDTSGDDGYSALRRDLSTPIDLTKYRYLEIQLYNSAGNDPNNIGYIEFYNNGTADENYACSYSGISKGFSTSEPAEVWTEWTVDLHDLNGWASDVTWSQLTSIQRIDIGVVRTSLPGGTGTITVDDIKWVDAVSCGFMITPGDFNGDCVVNFEDFADIAANWLLSF